MYYTVFDFVDKYAIIHRHPAEPYFDDMERYRDFIPVSRMPTFSEASAIFDVCVLNNCYDVWIGKATTVKIEDVEQPEAEVIRAEEAINTIEGLYPPDSEYDDTRAMGRDLMDNVVGNKTGYSNWRNLPENDLIALAIANLKRDGEDASRFC